MPSNIYNEGRVVGYSAYEVYVRHSRSINPDIEPASEAEWLASSLSLGDSLLLKVSADSAGQTNTPHWRSFALPTGTNLCDANTIIGSYFTGKGDDANLIDGKWAKSVLSYGCGVVNNSSKPNGNVTTSDMATISTGGKIPIYGTTLSEDEIVGLGEYAKILDGIVLSPGTWYNSGSQPPKDFTPFIGMSPTDPDYDTYKNEVPVIRLLFSGKVAHDFWLLFTGFSLSAVVRGETGVDSSVGTEHPQNGDFLGPATYPWANKIVFSIPPAFLKYYYDSGYIRKINNGPSTEVKSHAIIDMATTNPKTYYEDVNNDVSDSQVPLSISKLRITSDDAAILTVYQRSSLFPPALYGVKAVAEDDGTSTEDKLNPLDTVAPGTLKLFQNLQDADAYDKTKNFETQIPNNFGFYRNTNDFVVKQLDATLDDKPSVPIADTYTEPFVGSLSNTEAISPYFAAQTNSGEPSGYFFVHNIISRRISGCFSDSFKSDFGYIYTFNMLTSQTPPSDWTTDDGKKKYYKLENGGYVKIDDPSSLTYQADTYYLPTEPGQAIDVMEKMSFPSTPGAVDWTIGNGMKTYVISKYPTNWHTKYYFALSITKTSVSGRDIRGITIVPIEMATNKVDFIDKRYGGSLSLPWPLLPDANNLEEAETNYYKIEAGNYTDYLGTYWYTGSNPTLPSNHQKIQAYIDSINPSVASVTEPNRRVPANTRTEDAYTDWQDRYANVTLRQLFPQSKVIYDRDTNLGGVTRDMLGEFQYLYKLPRPNGNPQVVSYSGVHSDYWNCTLSEALRYAMFYDTTKSKETGLKPGGFRIPLFFCAKSSTSYDPETGISANGDLDITSTIKESSPKTISIPIPAEYRPTTGIQTVVNVAGYHQTKAVSLADADGADYPTSGTGGDVSPSDGKIHWDDLLNILANNQSIDLLNSETFLRNLMAFLNSHIQSSTGINSHYDNSTNTRTLSLSTENGSGISIATGTGGTDVESSGKHISANLAAGAGISIDNDSSSTKKTISANLAAGYGIKITDGTSPSTTKTIASKFVPGSGITFNTYGDTIQIGNGMMAGRLPYLAQGTDFTVSFTSGCCGKFQKTSVVADNNHAISIRYSKSIDGSPASIYIQGGRGLGASDFTSGGSSDSPSGFWFRHTADNRDTVSRMMKITFTAAGLTKLGISSIDDIYDTSSYFTGIWNIDPIGSDEPCGESWSAVCVTEKAASNAIYIAAISYGDGYNTQLGHWSQYDGSQLHSTHINLQVSCQIYPPTT